jgi:error-prone DNA polymerase
MPDIDVDFAADRREEVIRYVYERYGQEHVGMVCNLVTFRARSALRDVAKVLAFPPEACPERSRRVIDRTGCNWCLTARLSAAPQGASARG